MLLIFHNPDCTILNSFLKFNTIKDIICWSNNYLKYSDVKKKVRVYRKSKSFFRIFKVDEKDESIYFKYKYRDLRKF